MGSDSGVAGAAVGRRRVLTDWVTPRQVEEFRAMLGRHLADTGPAVPLGLHWCLAPEIVAAEGRDADGTGTGQFVPNFGRARRIWAGGTLALESPFHPGDAIERATTIAAITEKTGRAGRLVFVTLQHQISGPRGLAVNEEQMLVFRALADAGDPPAAAPAVPPVEAAPAHHTETVAIDPVLLFQFSALTFNAHRIHFDAPYARAAEGYAGLVVQGALQATLLLNLAARLSGKPPRHMAHRAVAPAAGVDALTLAARRRCPQTLDLSVITAAGLVTMTASVRC